MYRFVWFFMAVFVLAPLGASAQKILPDSLADWQQCSQTAASAGSRNPADSTASRDSLVGNDSILAEYGLRSRATQRYCRGTGTLSVTLSQMGDPSGAYGWYSYLRSPGMSRANFTDHSSLSSDQVLVLAGNLVLDVRGTEIEKQPRAIEALVSAVEAHAQAGPLPTLWQDLPPKDFVIGTDRYILGPETLNQLFPAPIGGSVGFSKGAEAELGRYRRNARDLTLLIVDFPTPQMAEGALTDISGEFNVNGSKPGSTSPELFASRQLTLLVFVAGAASPADAKSFLDEVRPGTMLTWDEPTFEFKEPSIATMVVGAIVGTGVICLFTIIASLAFGGFRLAVKRLMPGRVFDRSSEVQVLQLGLGSKPINAQDFYDTTGGPVGDVKIDKNLPDRIALRLFR